MNFDAKLEQIIDKYNINPFYEIRNNIHRIREFVRNYIASRLDEYCFLSVMPEDVNELILENGFFTTKYYLGADEKDLMDFIAKDESLKYMIISFGDFKKIKEVYKDKESVEYLYEAMVAAGFTVENTFYDTCKNALNPYMDISEYLFDYKINEDNGNVILSLVFKYLEIRDFANAIIFMEEYEKKQMEGHESITNLKKEIKALLDEIKKIIKEKQELSILMCWVDAVSFDELSEFPGLKKLESNSVCFKNAFTVMPYTTPTYHTIFEGKLPIEDKYHTYIHNMITPKTSEVLSQLEKKGFIFERYGEGMQLFERENCCYGDRLFNSLVNKEEHIALNELRKYKVADYRRDICPMILWKSVNSLVNNKKPFVLAHILRETHVPYVAGNIAGKAACSGFGLDVNKSQIPLAREYVDQQFGFYRNLWDGNVVTIICSDHGKIVGGKLGKTYRDLFHTVLMVDDYRVDPRQYDEIFSYVNFDKLIYSIILNDYSIVESAFSKYAKVENYDAYGTIYTASLNTEKLVMKRNVLGYRGIRTKDTLYMVRNDGKKQFFILPCQINQYGFADSSIEEEYYKEAFPGNGVDITDDIFFVNTRKIYKGIKKHDERVESLQKKADVLIEKLMGSISKDEIIALRGGADPANEIIIRFNNRIKYVIDNSITDEEGWPFIKYIKEGEIPQYREITTIIITSYELQKIMEDGLKDLHNINVINLYKYFKDNGLDLGEDYHADKISVSDIIS